MLILVYQKAGLVVVVVAVVVVSSRSSGHFFLVFAVVISRHQAQIPAIYLGISIGPRPHH